MFDTCPTLNYPELNRSVDTTHAYRARSRFSRHGETQRVVVAPPFRVRPQQDGLGSVITTAATVVRVTYRVARVVRSGRRLEQRYAQRRDARADVRRLGQMEQIEFGARQLSDRVHSRDLSVRRFDPRARVRAVAQHSGHVRFVQAACGTDEKKQKSNLQ